MVIIAAIDRSDRAADVVREAEALATAFDEPVHVLHVLSTSEFVNLGRTRAEEGDPIDLDEVREVAAVIAAEEADDLDVPFEAVGRMGDAAEVIVNHATDQNARYIVVSGRKRSPAGKAIFGSVTQSVLLKADCPVVSTINQAD